MKLRHLSHLLLLLCCLIPVAVSSYAQGIAQDTSTENEPKGPVISSIRVEGTQRIEPATVLSYMSLRAGEALTQDKVNQTIKALYATGFFSDVSMLLDGNVLVVKVAENPIVNRIAYEGNDDIKTEDLEKEVQLKPRNVFTKARVQADVDRILQVYRRSGRYAVTVEPKMVEREQNRVDLVFEINEGKQTGIEHIYFIGNKAYTASQLREAIATRETRWWRVFSNADYYDPDRVNFDRDLLRRYYLNNGYADFRVLSGVAELTPDKKDFFLTFTEEEGDKYKFGKVEIDTTLKNLDPKTLEDKLTTKTGETYSAEKVEKTITNLTNAVGDLQYAFVDINPDIDCDRDHHVINITYRIKEGQRVFIRNINVKGNTRTLDEVVRRELLVAEGDPYNASKIKQSEQRIKDLGYFDNVKIDVNKTDQSDQSDLVVNVTEKSTGEISVGAGYSTTDGVLGDFSIKEKNFLGRGQSVKASATISQRTQQYDFSFTEPYFLNRDLSAGFDLFKVDTNNQTSSSFDQNNVGITLRAGYPLSERLRQKLTYTLEDTDITNIDSTASRFILDQAGEAVTSSVGQELSYDARDSKLDPKEGFLVKLSNDLAGLGGDVKYVRSRIAGAYYYPLLDDLILNLNGEFGYITALGNDEVRISDRFFLGGDSLRGFEYAGVGPRDLTNGSDDALGGDRFTRGTVELSFPIGLPDELGIKGHTFVDAGTLDDLHVTALPGEDIRDDNTVRISSGVGLSWASPFGPIRVDLAKAIQKEDYDKTQVFRFSFGTNF